MPLAGTISQFSPYDFFGTFVGVPFWPGGLTLLPASPGAGKTSLLLWILFEAAAAGLAPPHGHTMTSTVWSR
jgi:hypothetical protein